MSKSGPDGPARAVIEGKIAEAKEGRDVSARHTESINFSHISRRHSHVVLLLHPKITSQII